MPWTAFAAVAEGSRSHQQVRAGSPVVQCRQVGQREVQAGNTGTGRGSHPASQRPGSAPGVREEPTAAISVVRRSAPGRPMAGSRIVGTDAPQRSVTLRPAAADAEATWSAG